MKKVLSFILVCALVIGLVPMTFAAETVRNTNEWVFTAASHGKSATLAYDLANKVTAFTMDETVASVSDKWEFVNQSGGSGYNIQADFFHFYGNSSSVPGFGARSFVFEIQTDLNGTVSPSITVSKNTYGVIWEIYLIEKPSNPEVWHCDTAIEGKEYGNLGNIAALAKSIDTKYRLGVIDAYSATTKVVTDVFPEITVKPGSYYLVGVANGANENWAKKHQMIDLVSFKMKNRALPEKVLFNYDITTNSLAADAQANYGGRMSKDGDAANYIDSGDTVYVSWKQVLSTSIPAAVDTTKTTGYQLYGRNQNDSTLEFTDAGMGATFIVGSDAEITDYNNWDGSRFLNTSTLSRPVYAIRIDVPEGGKYEVSILNRFISSDARVTDALSWSIQANGATKGTFDKGAMAKVHLVDADDVEYLVSQGLPFKYTAKGVISDTSNLDSLIADDKAMIGYYDSSKITTDRSSPVVTTLDKKVTLEKGEYYLVFDVDGDAFEAQPKAWGRKIGSTYNYYQTFLLSGIQLTPVDETDYDSVNDAYNSIVNVNPGNATEEKPANTTSNVQILCGVDKSVLDTKEVAAGTGITYTAPVKEGYTFLYWAQGIGEYKKIVSYDAKLSIKAEKGPMWLTAVYSDNSAAKTDVVFYNANGDEISRNQYEEDSVITLEVLPSMAGFETAKGWTLDTDGKTYTAEDEVRASGRLMRFVAEYADAPSESFDITVVGGTADNAAPVYGDTVTVTATPRNGAKLFNYWQKDGEIVSFDLSYSFKAYKDTTVTAVYNDYLPAADTIRKIIIGTRPVGLETAAVAEFIGISDAVEKGILFGTNLDDATHKVSMKTEGDTFSVIDDVAASAIGYAILSNGNAIYSK